jgi:hypothetical protein
MQKPTTPTIPGMTDTLDFVKNLWGSMNIPGTGMPGMSGLSTPALSIEELDKKIADLKAVESWLNINISMLRGTIQTMEVQRGTLAALKSMSASMAEAMRQSGVGTDKMAGMPFAAFFTPPGQSTPAKPAAPAPSASSAAPAGSDASAAGGAAPGMPAAVAWWNMLQDQFTQAVSSAMSPAAAPAAPATAPASASSSSPASSAATAPAAPSAPSQNAAPPGAKPRTDKP